MIYLATNTAGQTIYMNLAESRPFIPTFTHYLFVFKYDEHGAGGSPVGVVATIGYENWRVTELTLSTVGILLTGRYSYVVYGQNSSSNIDPTNATVQGIVTQGMCMISRDIIYYTAPAITIPSNINYES
jgi:hypothetical protein